MKEATEKLPDDINLSEYIPLNSMEHIEGRYQVLIEFKTEDGDEDKTQPVGDMFLYFEKKLSLENAKTTIMHTAIKNGVLNILNSLASVKGFNTYSDYLVLLGLADGQDKVIKQLDSTFKFSLKFISEEDYKKELEQRAKDTKEASDTKDTMGADDILDDVVGDNKDIEIATKD